MKVVIIDNGISERYVQHKISHYKIYRKQIVKNNNKIIENTHGTIVAAIFLSYFKNCEIIDLKITNSNLASIDMLILALHWCVQTNIDVINMSLGTSDFLERKMLHPLIEKLYYQKKIIVAASNNKKYITFPAAFPEVLSVKFDWDNSIPKNCFRLVFDRFDGVDMIVNKKIEISEWDIVMSNSFVTPFVTALVCRCLEAGIHDLECIKKKLCDEGVHTEYSLIDSNIGMEVNIPIVEFNDDKDVTLSFLSSIITFFEEKGYICAIINNAFHKPEKAIFKYTKEYRIDIIINQILSIISGLNIIFIVNCDFDGNEVDIKILKNATDVIFFYDDITEKISSPILPNVLNRVLDILE